MPREAVEVFRTANPTRFVWISTSKFQLIDLITQIKIVQKLTPGDAKFFVMLIVRNEIN